MAMNSAVQIRPLLPTIDTSFVIRHKMGMNGKKKKKEERKMIKKPTQIKYLGIIICMVVIPVFIFIETNGQGYFRRFLQLLLMDPFIQLLIFVSISYLILFLLYLIYSKIKGRKKNDSKM